MLTHRAGKNIHQHLQSKNPRRRYGVKITDPDVLLRFQSNALAIRRQTGWTTADDTFTPGFGYRNLAPVDIATKKGLIISAGDNLQYTRGSLQGGDGSGVVRENANGNQIGIELWLRPNQNGNDGTRWQILDIRADASNQIQLYKNTSNNLILEFKGNGTSKTASVSVSTWVAGTWYYVTAMADKNNVVDTGQYLQVRWNNTNVSADGTTTPTALASLPANFQLGQDYANANQFNGVIAGQIRCLPLTTTEITNRYASGAGHTDTFTVDATTIWLGTYSDSNDDAIFWHRGQSVSSISNGATESTLTLGQAVGLRSWADNQRVCIWDGTGYKKEGLIDEASIATTDTTLDVDNGSGALVTDLDKVGKALSFDGTDDYVSKTNFSLSSWGDLSMSLWVRTTDTDAVLLNSVYNAGGSNPYFTILIGSSGYISFRFSSASGSLTKAGTISITDNKWHFVAVSRISGGAVKLYIDGVLDTSGTDLAGTWSKSDTPIYIGAIAAQNANYLNGLIDDVCIYKIALTAADILWLATHPNPTLQEIFDNTTANAGVGAADDDVVLYHNYRNGNLTDLSEYANNGTFSGGTATYPQQAFISRSIVADGEMEQGGIGAWTAGDAATTLAKDTTTVKFDTRSLKITNGDATQGFTRQTITTAAGEDYRFHGWFYAPTTPNGASQLVDVDGTAALGITVTQAGATVAATWYEIDFTFEAADVSTTIDLGSGSITNAQIGYWDNVKVQRNLVDKGGMEGTYVSGLAPGWTNQGAATVASSATVHSGSLAQQVTGGSTTQNVTQNITVVSGKYYTVSGWLARSSGTGNTTMELSGATTKTITHATATYTKYSHPFKAGSTTLTIELYNSEGATVGLFDDISLIEPDRQTPTTATPSSEANSFVTGKWADSGGAFIVDGADMLAIATANNILTNRLTVCFWAKLNFNYNDSRIGYLFDVRGADDNNRVSLYYDNASDKFVYYVNGGERALSAAQVNNTLFFTWVHFAFSYDFTNDVYKFYINGALIGTNNDTLAEPTFGSNFFLGTDYNGNNPSDAVFDELRIYKRQLTDTEVAGVYNSAPVI